MVRAVIRAAKQTSSALSQAVAGNPGAIHSRAGGDAYRNHRAHGVGVAETVGDVVPVTVGLDVGVTETDGLGDGDVGVGVADGDTLVAELDGLAVLRDGLGELAAGAGVLPWAGPRRLGVCTGWWLGASIRATAATITPSTATTPPVAAPAAKACRSRRYSLCRRSRSHAGSVARCAAQLLTGAAAMPSVGDSSSTASSTPLSWVALVSA